MKRATTKIIDSQLSSFRVVSFYGSILFVILALAGIFNKGLSLGLDFTGGYLTEFTTSEVVSQQEMQQSLTQYLPAGFQLSSAENGTYWSIRQADTESSITGSTWLNDFMLTFKQSHANYVDITITPQDAIYIGSQVGEELINQGGLALLTALVVILLYLSLRFEWRLALGAIVALFHDVIVVLGIFAWLGLSFDLTILASLLAIIGYSLNDSIIVGDKIRELMKCNNEHSIAALINQAIKSTFARTLITSGTTLATILAIWFFAGESLSGFAVALFSGVLVGTFSSIAISSTIPQLLGLTADYYQVKETAVCQLP